MSAEQGREGQQALLPPSTKAIECRQCGAMADNRVYCKGLGGMGIPEHPSWTLALNVVMGCVLAAPHLHVVCKQCGAHAYMQTKEQASMERHALEQLMRSVGKPGS